MALDLLVVDRSPALRRMMHRTLRMGALSVDHVHEAGDAQQAVQLLDEHWVDGIIAEWECRMEKDRRLVEWLTSDEVMHEVPTLTLTADGRPGSVEKIMNRNIFDLLVKPFRPEQLYQKIETLTSYDRG